MFFFMTLFIMYVGILFLLKYDKDTRLKKVNMYYPGNSEFNNVVEIPKNRLSFIYYKTLTSAEVLKLAGAIALVLIRKSIIALFWIPVGIFTGLFLYGCLNPTAFSGDAALTLPEFFTAIQHSFFSLWGMATIIKCSCDILKGNAIPAFERNMRRIFTLKFCEETETPIFSGTEARIIK